MWKKLNDSSISCQQWDQQSELVHTCFLFRHHPFLSSAILMLIISSQWALHFSKEISLLSAVLWRRAKDTDTDTGPLVCCYILDQRVLSLRALLEESEFFFKWENKSQGLWRPISAHTFHYTPLRNSVKQSGRQKLSIEGNGRVFIL